MASNATVIVKNIAPATSDSEIKDFFSFCGKIADLKVTSEGETKSAEVTFEKETAKKTALLLNNTQLGSNQLSVTAAGAETDEEHSHEPKERDTDEITQEEKPRARILAEYLAHGYVVGDVAIERAIELDTKHKVSNRFVNTLNNLNQKYHATDRARATDQNYGITTRAGSLWSGLGSYFEKASSNPTGKKLVQFYEQGSKQVQEVHAEARRLADLKKEAHGGNAYKASGLEKVFGKEKEAAPAPEAAPAAGSVPAPAPAAGTAVPPEGVKPTDEKTTYA